MTLTITIAGAPYAPSWTTLQHLVSTMVDKPWTVNGLKGKFTRIARLDGQRDYSTKGTYHCDFTPEEGDQINVVLHVL